MALARKVYRTAQAAQQQLIQLYYRSPRQGMMVTQKAGLNIRASVNFKSDRQVHSVFDASSPTWNTQFPEKYRVVTPGSIGDSSSPASYATSLYALATQLEHITPENGTRINISLRRSDMGDILLNDITVNQALPKLDIVNGILLNGLSESNNNQALVKELQQQNVLPNTITQFPTDALLSRLHYPSAALPYHEPHDHIITALAIHKTSLGALTYLVQTRIQSFCLIDGDATLSNRILEQSAKLNPAEVSLIAKKPVFETYILDGMSLTTGEHGWRGPSVTEISPWHKIDECIFIIPAQEGSVGPEHANSSDGGMVPDAWHITLDNKQEVVLNAVRVDGYYWTASAISAIYNDPLLNNLFIRLPALPPDLPVNPVRGSIRIRSVTNDNSYGGTDIPNTPVTEFTVSIILSSKNSETFSTLLTPKQQSFFSYNYGVTSVDNLEHLSDFSYSTDLSTEDAMKLLCVAGVGDKNTTVVASENIIQKNSIFSNGNSSETFPAPYHYGAVFIHAGKLPRLSLKQDANSELICIDGLRIINGDSKVVLYDRYDRFDRLIRLQRRTGLEFDQLDNLVVSAMRAEGQNNLLLTMNTHTVRVIGFYQCWNHAYGLCAEDLSAFLHEITSFAVGSSLPQFDRLFNPRTGLGQAPFKIDNSPFDHTATEGPDAETVRQLCAGLKVTEAEFEMMADLVNTTQNLLKGKLIRSLPVVSALYRLSKIPALLGLSIAEMKALLTLIPRGKTLLEQLAGIPKLSELDSNGQPLGPDLLNDLQTLAEMIRWMQLQKLAVADLVILLTPVSTSLPASLEDVALVNDINQHLSNILFNINNLHNSMLPSADTTGAPLDWLTLLTENSAGVIDKYGLVSIESETKRKLAISTLVNAQKLTDNDKMAAISFLESSLAGVLRSQQSLIDTQLSKQLTVAQGVISAILPCLSLSSYELLNICQSLDNPNLTPADIPATWMRPLNSLAHYTLFSTHYQLTPAVFRTMFDLPHAFGGDTALTLKLLAVMADFIFWRQKAGKEDDILQYLKDVNSSTPPSPTNATIRLAKMLKADTNKVQRAIDLITQSPPDTGLASTVVQVGHVLRVLNCSEATGLSVSVLSQLSELGVTEGVLDNSTTDDNAFTTWRSAGLAVMATLGIVNSQLAV